MPPHGQCCTNEGGSAGTCARSAASSSAPSSGCWPSYVAYSPAGGAGSTCSGRQSRQMACRGIASALLQRRCQGWHCATAVQWLRHVRTHQTAAPIHPVGHHSLAGTTVRSGCGTPLPCGAALHRPEQRAAPRGTSRCKCVQRRAPRRAALTMLCSHLCDMPHHASPAAVGLGVRAVVHVG